MPDPKSDRVIELCRRLNDTEIGLMISSTAAPSVKPSIVEQCTRLNRLGIRAERNDYATLYTDGQDNFSAMSLADLQDLIPSSKWTEMQIRLRAFGMLESTNMTKTARWVARGLDVYHAIKKVQIDAEIYAVDRSKDSKR